MKSLVFLFAVNLLVTECLRPIAGLVDPLLCPDIDTDINEPMESAPILYAFDSCKTRDTPASDDPVSVDTGLVFVDVNELYDCTGPFIRLLIRLELSST